MWEDPCNVLKPHYRFESCPDYQTKHMNMRPDLESIPTPALNDFPSEYMPNADELRQRHEVNIQFLTSGCVVRVGCKSIAFTDIDIAAREVAAYVKDPIASYKKWADTLNVKF